MKATRRVKGVLLFPGAGSSADHSSLVRVERELAPLPVRRADFPYRLAGKRAPDRTPVLLDAVRGAAGGFASSAGIRPDTIVLGGRSMGGRMCSMAVAGGSDPAAPVAAGSRDANGSPLPAAGLVLISYPLHPPGKPEALRVEHLPRLDLPCLFIHGDKDPFGTPDELRRWSATIPGPVTHVWIDGKGHDLKGADARISDEIAAWLPTIR